MSAVQQGHFVAFMSIVEKHLGQAFVVISSSFSHSLIAVAFNLFITFFIHP